MTSGAARTTDAMVAALPALPIGAEGPVFNAPWEAQAFALAVVLQRRGVFTWDEWAEALGKAIRAAQQQGDPDVGTTHYHHWLEALEAMVAMKSIAAEGALARHAEAWRQAALRTPHGQPIELRESDFRP